MSLQIPLATLTGKTTSWYLNVTFNGKPMDLTGYTPQVITKASATVLDNTGHAYTVGSGLTWINQKLGKLQLTIPSTDVATAGTFWWRLDITDQNNAPYNVFYGPLTIKAV